MDKRKAALNYAMQGYPIFPCHNVTDGVCSCGDPDCKSPGKHPRIAGGLKHATTEIAQVDEWWQRWPDANIALCFQGTGLFALDIDRGGDRDGFLWLEAMESQLPAAPTQITPSGGQHLIYRVPEGVTIRNSASDLARGVDVRGDGGYIMVEPSDHAAGSSYYWEDELEAFDPIPDAPEWLCDLIGTSARMSRPSGAQKWRLSRHLDEDKRWEIESALEYVDPDSRDSWLRVGMAIHSEYANEDGFDLWSEWSSKSDKFDPKDQRYTWDRLDSYGGVSVAAIFGIAQDAGWVNPAAGSAEEPETPTTPLKAWEQPAQARTLPDHLLAGGKVGALGLFVDWATESAYRPQPVLALAAGVSMFGTVFGRFFEGLGARTNIFTLGVAVSGAGKEHARRCSKRLLAEANMDPLLGAEEFASGAAIYKELQQHHTRFFLLDEFGLVMEKIASGRASTWEREIGDAFLKIYNGASDECVRGKARAGADREDLHQPHACIYGTSTPGFYDALSSKVAAGGLLSRFLVFDVPGDPPRRNRRPDRGDPPSALVDALDRFREWQIEERAKIGNLGNVASHGVKPKIVEVEFAEEAEDLIFDVLEQEVLEARQKSGDSFGEIWARVEEQTIKLALIRCLCAWISKPIKSAGLPVVSVEDAKWAKDVVLWCTSRLVLESEERIANSKAEKALKMVRRALRKSAPDWVSRSKLTRATQSLSGREREDALKTLIEIGDAEKEESREAERGPKQTRYRATQEA